MKSFGYVFVFLVGTVALYVGISGWVVADFEARLEKQKREDPVPARPSAPVGDPVKPGAEEAAQGDAKSRSSEVIYQGISFDNEIDARQAAEGERINRCFRWVYQVPVGLPILLTSLAFGFLGGIANIAHKLAGSEAVSGLMMVFKPLFGGVIGLMVFGLCTALPKLMVESADGVRPVTMIFLCLFGGTFSNHVFAWVEEKTKMFFPLGASGPAVPTVPSPPSRFLPPTP
jgi:hypothetical protein